MTDDFDARLVSALRTLERDPEPEARAAVGKRVRRHRRQRVLSASAAVAIVVVIAVVVAVTVGNSDAPNQITAGPSGDSQPAPPALSAANTGIVTFPSTVAEGGEISAVLRNPLSGANVSCFLVVHLERWNGAKWIAVRDLLANGIYHDVVGPGADCAPDLMLPGAFMGEQTFTIPNDVEPGDYRLVDEGTEGEGRITIVGPGSNPALEARPVSTSSIDLAEGGDLGRAVPATITRAVVLDDNRLAIAWDSECNAPARRIDFDYGPDRVTAQLVVGTFVIKDCVGSPSAWSTVVDLPAPLWGREVVVDSGTSKVTAERIGATPISTFVLPEAAPGSESAPILGTSIFRQRPTGSSIELDVFGKSCLDNAQSVVLRGDNDEIFVQPLVQLWQLGPADDCFSAPGTYPITVTGSVPEGTTLFGPG